MIKTDTDIITIAVEHHLAGLTTVSHAICSAFMVSLLSGENDMAQPTGFLANRSRTTARYAQRLPVQSRVRDRA